MMSGFAASGAVVDMGLAAQAEFAATVFCNTGRVVDDVDSLLSGDGREDLSALQAPLEALRALQGGGAYTIGDADRAAHAIRDVGHVLRAHPAVWSSFTEGGRFSAQALDGTLADAIDHGRTMLPDMNPALRQLGTFLATIFVQGIDGTIATSEANHDQLRALLNQPADTDVSHATIKDVLYYLVTTVGHEPAALAAHVTTALVDKEGAYMYVSGKSALHMAQSLGLHVDEGRIARAEFQAKLQSYLESKPVGKPQYTAARPTAANAVDPFTQSNYRQCPVTHVDMDLIFDFEAQQVQGVATYTLGRQDENRLALDTKSLDIARVEVQRTAGGDWVEVDFTLGEEREYIGRALDIDLQGPVQAVRVRYATNTENRASGLQWLSPEQTSSGQKPFLFTQGQYSHNRGWVPLQDTSMAKMTMTSRMRVKSDLGVRAVMVSDQAHEGRAQVPTNDGDYDVYEYKVDQPIAPYLLAVAIGELDAHSVSDRSILYAEPAMMDKAKRDYEIYEAILEVLEEILGPLPSRVLDTVIMPPSFPWGGMENLGLNMNSGTIITGDRSQMSVAIHEAVHGWFGNLVTNATRGDFWLNEGFTMWVQRYAMRKLAERGLLGEEDEALSAITGEQHLDGQVISRIDAGKATALGVVYAFDDPDEGVTVLPYEKGYFFLRWLSNKIGDEDFAIFLRTYLGDFKYQALTTEDFRRYLENYFSLDEFEITASDLDLWLYGPGMPDETPVIESPQYTQIQELAVQWLASPNTLQDIPDRESWGYRQWVLFLTQFVEAGTVPVPILDELQRTYGLDASRDPEIACTWFLLVARNRYRASYPAMEQFLDGSIGRLKYLQYIFRQLMDSGEEEFARKVYRKMRSKLHRIAQGVLEKILKIKVEVQTDVS